MDDSTERTLRLLGNAAQVLAPLIPGGGVAVMAAQNAPALIAAGASILDAIKNVRAAHDGPVPDEAVRGEAGLMEKVRAHAEGTFDRAERGDR